MSSGVALERNLHDGAQQRLVTVSLSCGSHWRSSSPTQRPRGLPSRRQGRACACARRAAGLARGFIRRCSPSAACGPVEALAGQMPIPSRPPASRRAAPGARRSPAAYYLIAEDSHQRDEVRPCVHSAHPASASDGTIVVEVSDDGVGGAGPASGQASEVWPIASRPGRIAGRRGADRRRDISAGWSRSGRGLIRAVVAPPSGTTLHLQNRDSRYDQHAARR